MVGAASKKQQRITKIRIGGHGSPKEGNPTADLPLPKERRGRRGFRAGRIREIVEDAFGTREAETLLNGVADDSEVTLQIILGFPKGADGDEPGLPLTQIEDAIRNLDEGDIALIAPDGSVVGDEVRSHHRGRVDLINGLPEPDSVLRLMREAYADFLERKIIVPTSLPQPTSTA